MKLRKAKMIEKGSMFKGWVVWVHSVQPCVLEVAEGEHKGLVLRGKEAIQFLDEPEDFDLTGEEVVLFREWQALKKIQAVGDVFCLESIYD